MAENLDESALRPAADAYDIKRFMENAVQGSGGGYDDAEMRDKLLPEISQRVLIGEN